MPGSSGHKRGEEADALAALSRALREAGAATQTKGSNAGRDQQASWHCDGRAEGLPRGLQLVLHCTMFFLLEKLTNSVLLL